MTGLDGSETDDQYLQEMKSARDRTAVLKIMLVELRSSFPDKQIFVFEGIDDKIVYYHWIRNLRPDITYEPLPCGNKRNVLRLRDVCSRDLNNLANGVYYFIDRDFDDLGSFSKAENTFMTDCYSIENYLVNDRILDDLLTNEFHCHAKPEVRQRIHALFTAIYRNFISISRVINFRIFMARKLGIDIIPAIPDRVNKLFSLNLTIISLVSTPEIMIKLNREPEFHEVVSMDSQFRSLDPITRYRGKFVLKFFLRWLELLADEYAARATDLFRGIEGTYVVRRHELGIGMLAARSQPPSELGAFLSNTR
jgi:Protein of unknown function (DUF4435)